MAFTYSLDDTGDNLLVAKVRFEIGDTVEGSGILPSGANLSNEEILYYLDLYSDDVMQTAGALCSVLSRHWANAADITVGPRREQLSQISQQWSDRAEELNPRHASFAIGVQRDDGYSDNAESESEYT